MYEFENEEQTVELATGKRDRYGYGFVSDRKAADRSLSLSRDISVSRVSKSVRRAGKRSDKRAALNAAWKSVR